MFENRGRGELEALTQTFNGGLDRAKHIYYWQRDQLRYGEVTSLPNMKHKINLNLKYKAAETLNLNAGLAATLGTNDNAPELDFKQNMFQPKFGLNYFPNEDFMFYGNYSYVMRSQNGLATVALMDGWASHFLASGGAFANGDSIKHFGSGWAEFEYESKAHIFFAGINYKLSSSVKFDLTGSYSNSEASFDEVEMPVNESKFQEAQHAIHEGDYDYSEMNTYSDMSYSYLNLGASIKVKVTDNLLFKLGLDYHDLTDDKTYVYGNETGSFFIVKTGFQFGNIFW